MRAPGTGRIAVAIFAIGAFIIHILTANGYGYFRDELYYIACSRHLSFGYVDHPPLSILLLALNRYLLGDSLLALRFLPAVAAALLVMLTAKFAKEVGAGAFGQTLAALSVLVAPVLLVTQSFYSMNAFEPIFWTAAAFIIARLINTGDTRLWMLFGVIAGLGIENKHSMLFMCFGIEVGILLTSARRLLFSRWLLVGAGVAIALVIPNLIWEASNRWPTLEFMRNAQANKNYHSSIVEFALGQIFIINPLNFPIWMAGLYYYLAGENGRRYRALGIAYLAVAAVMVAQGAKIYYLAAIYPILLAGGAAYIEEFVRTRDLGWIRPASIAALAISLIVLAPLVLPILPPATLMGLQSRTSSHAKMVLEGERSERATLPQVFADRFGWPEMAAKVAEVYRALPDQERSRCAIVANNYGEAGAIDFFGPAFDLPPASSPHNNYWIWGLHPPDPQIVIVVGGSEERMRELFTQVERAAVFTCDYCMPYENDLPIYVCRGPKLPLHELWLRAKMFI